MNEIVSKVVSTVYIVLKICNSCATRVNIDSRALIVSTHTYLLRLLLQ